MDPHGLPDVSTAGHGPPPGAYGPPPGGGFGPPPGGGGYGPPPDAYGPPGPGAPWGAPPGAMVVAPYGIHALSGIPYSDKSRVVAGLLQLFVPGIGRFYTGHTTIGVIQLVVLFATCGVGILWPFVDGIMMLMGKVPDSDGRILRESI